MTQKFGGEEDGEWEVVGCLFGCDDTEHTCDATTLNASSGNTWTACLCNGDWSLQNCSAAVVQMPNGDTDSLCLRGGCTNCVENDCQPVAKVIPHGTAPLTPGASLPDLDESTESPAIRRLAHDAIDTIPHESTSTTGFHATPEGDPRRECYCQ